MLCLGCHYAGIYQLEAALEVKQKGQVILGLGLATLVPTAGTSIIKVGSVDGVRVAGLLLEAGQVGSDLGELLPLLLDPLLEVTHICCCLGPEGLHLLQVHSHLIHLHLMFLLGLSSLEL